MNPEYSTDSIPPVYRVRRERKSAFMPRLSYRLACLSLLAVLIQSLGHIVDLPHIKVPPVWIAAWWVTITAGCVGALLGAACMIRMRRSLSRFGRSYALAATVVGSAGALIGLFSYPIIENSAMRLHDSPGRRLSCLSNVKQLSLGVIMYAQDYDDRLPLANTWKDASFPYIKNEQVFICPSSPDGHDSKTPTYAFLLKLAGANTNLVASPPQDTVLIFDSIQGQNLTGGTNLLPDPPRHGEGDNIGFLDGHVKLVKRNELQTVVWSPKFKPPAIKSNKGAAKSVR